jgi:formate C-acetyltransferase
MFKTGFLDLKNEIRKSLTSLDHNLDILAYEKSEELKAMDIACDAIITYANRHADEL